MSGLPDGSQSFLAFHPEIHPLEFLQRKQIPGLGLRLSGLSILAGYRIWTDSDFLSAHRRQLTALSGPTADEKSF